MKKTELRELALNIVQILVILGVIGGLIYYITQLDKNPLSKITRTRVNDFESMSFNIKKVQDKYLSLINYIGNPTYVEMSANGKLNSATWMAPLNNYTPGFAGGKTHRNNPEGLDYIKINGFLMLYII